MKVRTELRAGSTNAINAVAAIAKVRTDLAQLNSTGNTYVASSSSATQSNTATVTSTATATATGGTQTAAASS